ncbi:hypothetical protein BD309DRAFT_949988 [Dichomitus squalens]|uniref:Uncharacterized protein n=1 Tax=Dichomitus squalens TaxID=114155 RepID=A0A4Q9PUM1_9APHY|nr:hypothetical protein BD309DRAFT_949988 [Dichomitus squalens]TBU58150.1 hypothetical protein BD310DRAFT_879511 [Dichomitus squalens]
MADIEDTIGAILVGALISAILSGTVATQVFLYLKLYGTDDYKRNTFIVCTLWTLDSLHLAMVFASCWIYLIRNFGNTTICDYIPWTIALTVALTAIVTLISHCFFAHRIYMLSKQSWTLTAPIILLAVGRLAAALVSTSEMINLRSYSAFVSQVGWVFTTGLSLSTSVDVLITVILITLLQRSRTGFSTLTDRLIDVVTVYTLETGLLTCITTAVSLICWLTMPQNLIFLALHFSIPKLYATSTLATLNARKSLRRRTYPPDQHILPVISSLPSLPKAQSQTQRDLGEASDSQLKATNSTSPGRTRTVTPLDAKHVTGKDATPTHDIIDELGFAELGIRGPIPIPVTVSLPVPERTRTHARTSSLPLPLTL